MVKLAALAVAVALLAPAATVAGVQFAKEDLQSDDSLWKLYELWCARHKVARDPGEKLRRFAIFKEKARRVYSFHLQVAGGTPLGLNIFADQSDDEVRRDYRCGRPGPGVVNHGGMMERNVSAAVKRRGGDGTLPLPVEFDWRAKSCNGRPCLSPVKRQGPRCGACWAFAATAALESHSAIRRNMRVRLSEQQLVDCDTHSFGCAGGFAIAAFYYVAKNGGLASSADYPYRARNGTCKAAATSQVDLGMTGYSRVPAYDEFQLLQAVTYGPVVVPIAATNSSSFYDYAGGLYRGPCGPAITHEMLLVGYGYDHYVLRNSFGEGWGDKGYMLLPRDSGSLGVLGTCRILMDGSAYPEIESL
uniref:Uncharacterized protein n=1 Tax=Avena sativa TaxID=4498 RepID=A0ACD5XUT2_AVESA